MAWLISLLLWKSSVVEFLNYIHSKALPLPFGMNKRDATSVEKEHDKSMFDGSERSGITDSTYEEVYSDLESPLPPIGDTFLLPVRQKTRVQPEERSSAKNSSRQRTYRQVPTNELDCTILHVQHRPDPIERLVSEDLGSGNNQNDQLKSTEDLSPHDSDHKVVVPREKIHTGRRNLDRVGASSSPPRPPPPPPSFAHSTPTSTGYVRGSSSSTQNNRRNHQNDQPKIIPVANVNRRAVIAADIMRANVTTDDMFSHDSDPKSVIPREKNHSSNIERASPLPFAHTTPPTGFVRRASQQSFKSNLSPLHEGSLECSSRTGTSGSNLTPAPSPSKDLIAFTPSRKGRITENNSLKMSKDDKQLKSHIVVTRTTTPPPPPPPPRRNINKNQRQGGETNDKILNQLHTKKKSKSFDCRLLSTTNTHRLQVPENHGNSIEESDFIMSDIDILLSGSNSVVTELSEGTAKARDSDLHTPPLMMSLLSVDVISAIHDAAVSANKKKRIDSTIKEWEKSIRSTDEFLASSMRLNSRK
jgi:hypothetical protein